MTPSTHPPSFAMTRTLEFERVAKMNERGAEFLRDQQTREQCRAQMADMFAQNEENAAMLLTVAFEVARNPGFIREVPDRIVALIGCLAAIGGTSLGEQVVEAQLMEAGAL